MWNELYVAYKYVGERSGLYVYSNKLSFVVEEERKRGECNMKVCMQIYLILSDNSESVWMYDLMRVSEIRSKAWGFNYI